MLRHLLLLLLFFPAGLLNAQQLYEREYSLASCVGLSYKGHVIKTSDKGYMLVSVREDTVAHEWRINAMKTDSFGRVEWTALVNDKVPFAYDTYVTQTSDNGYLVSGSVWERLNDTINKWSDCFLVKLNSGGNYQWARRYGRKGIHDLSRCVFRLGSRIVLAGHTFNQDSSKAFLSFLDNSGNLISTVEYKGLDLIMNYAIPLAGNEIMVAGQRTDTLNGSCYFMKTDSVGAILWSKAIPNTNDFTTLFIEPARNGDVLFTGRTGNAGAGGWDIFSLRVSGAGALKFCRTYGGFSYDEGFSIHETSNGNILLFAEPESFLPGCQTSSILIDSNGTFIAMRGYGKKENYPFAAVRNNEDSTYTLFGVKTGAAGGIAPVFMTRIDENGNFPCQDTAISPFVSAMLGFNNFPITSSTYTAYTDTSFNFFKSQESILTSCGQVPDPPPPPEQDTLIVSNVFTPNGDGYNDVFYIQSQGLEELHYDIYNRWGIKVYEAGRIKQGWDGHSTSGIECAEGVYYYVLKAKAKSGTEYNRHGFLQLLR